MVTKFGSQILGTKFGLVPDCWPELEQLEHLHSEDTPAASWLPILLSHIGQKSKLQI